MIRGSDAGTSIAATTGSKPSAVVESVDRLYWEVEDEDLVDVEDIFVVLLLLDSVPIELTKLETLEVAEETFDDVDGVDIASLGSYATKSTTNNVSSPTETALKVCSAGSKSPKSPIVYKR